MGYDAGSTGDNTSADDGYVNSFLSADEIDQFRRKAKAACNDSPLRYKDRIAPLSDIVSRWKTQLGENSTAGRFVTPLTTFPAWKVCELAHVRWW